MSDSCDRPGADPVRLVREALAEGRLTLAFQPVLSACAARRVAFHEALIRVVARDGSVIPAGAFIDAVEPLALGRAVDRVALDLALCALAATADLRLAVNMSVLTMEDPWWSRRLADGLGADPTLAERLIIEVTEHSAVTAPLRLAAFMAALRARGVSFALDDFGAGATALSHFKRMQFDILKVHGDFFRGISGDADNRAVVRAVVSIARHFEMLTVAEFIENAEDAACATALGIDCLQGFHLGRPELRPSWIAPAEPLRKVV